MATAFALGATIERFVGSNPTTSKFGGLVLMGTCCCIYCKKEISTNGIFIHVDRTHLGKTRQSKIEEYNNNPKRCKQCNITLDYSIKRNMFCSSSCSATYTNEQRKANGWVMSKESREKTRFSISAYRKANPHLPQVITPFVKYCEHCHSEFITKCKSRRFCSTFCAKTWASKKARSIWPELKKYRAECSFKFNLKDFPEEFNFSIIEEFGWYSAKNRGNNLRGVSRDHMISVRWGFDNNIDSNIISHPANCNLIQHNENSSKGPSCSITLDDLLNKIVLWESKYNS